MDFLNWVKRVGILNSADSFEKFVSSQQEHSSRIVVGVAVKQFEVTSATMSCLYIRNKWRESIGLTMILHVYMGIAKRQNNVTYFVWSQFKYKMAWLGLPFPSHSHSLSVCLYTIQTHGTAPDSCLIGYIICIRCVCILCIHIDRVSFFCFTSWIPKATQFLIYAYYVCVCVCELASFELMLIIVCRFCHTFSFSSCLLAMKYQLSGYKWESWFGIGYAFVHQAKWIRIISPCSTIYMVYLYTRISWWIFAYSKIRVAFSRNICLDALLKNGFSVRILIHSHS